MAAQFPTAWFTVRLKRLLGTVTLFSFLFYALSMYVISLSCVFRLCLVFGDRCSFLPALGLPRKLQARKGRTRITGAKAPPWYVCVPSSAMCQALLVVSSMYWRWRCLLLWVLFSFLYSLSLNSTKHCPFCETFYLGQACTLWLTFVSHQALPWHELLSFVFSSIFN